MAFCYGIFFALLVFIAVQPNEIMKHILVNNEGYVLERTNGAHIVDLTKLSENFVSGSSSGICVEILSQAAYDSLQTKDDDTLYFISGTTQYMSEYLEDNFCRKPVVLYETDGTTGLSGVNANTLGENWQLTGYDFSPYKYLKCYFKVSDFKTSSNYLTPAIVVELPLDNASRAKRDNSATSPSTPCDMYLAGGNATNPNDRDVSINAIVAVDTTKTKFQVVSVHSIAGTILGERNSDGRYCYKIEGHFD